MNINAKIILLIAACVVSAGCQQHQTKPVEPEFDRFNMPETWSVEASNQSSDSGSLLSLAYSEELELLVRQALNQNPDLEQTLLTFKIAQLEVNRTSAAWWPTLNAGLSQSRADGETTSYTGSVSSSWQIDLFGQTYDSVQASQLDASQQEALYEAAKNSLVAQVIQTWLLLSNQYHLNDIQTQRVASLQKTEQFIVQRFRNGLGSAEDLNTARSRRLQAEATLSSQQETLNQLKRGLLVLTGQTPQSIQLVSVVTTYPELALPLVDLPKQTLARRPDVRAAYAAAQAADKRRSVAYKEMLPSIDLQAALQESADTPAAALLKDPVWTLLSQLSAPLFQGGALRTNADQQSLRAASAYEAYRGTLLTAVQEVEDALGLETTLAEQQKLLEESLQRANQTLGQYQRNYRSGLVTILDLLTVEQNTYDLKSQLDSVTYNRLSNRIDLGLALGLSGVNGEQS